MLEHHEYLESGKGYRVQLLRNPLERPFERVELDAVAGARALQWMFSRPTRTGAGAA